MRTIYSILLLSSFFLASCEKEEKPYKLPDPGPAQVHKVGMGSSYEIVVFVDVDKGVMELRDLYSWDIAFENGDSGKQLMINGGIGIQVAPTGTYDFDAIKTPGGYDWKWDSPTGHKDTTAFGNWLNTDGSSKQEVFIVDLGPKHTHDRYKKLLLVSGDKSTYRLRYSNMDGSDEQVLDIKKELSGGFTYFNLSENKVVTGYEPSIGWDLVFTRYRHVYYEMNPVTPYEVNGALVNMNLVQVAVEEDKAFEDIKLDHALTLDFTNRKDAVGFDWKYYDFNAQSYVTNLKRVFIIRSDEGLYYKLRFIDFYDENGLKGNPTYELQRL